MCPSGHIAKCSNDKCQNIPGRCLRNMFDKLGDIRGPVLCVGRVSLSELRRGVVPAVAIFCRPSQSAR